MRKIYYVFENYVSGLCPSVESVVVEKDGLKEINVNADEINVVFQESDKIILSVYARKDITVREFQNLVNTFKFFNINLEFIKYNIIPFTNSCLIEFEVCGDE